MSYGWIILIIVLICIVAFAVLDKSNDRENACISTGGTVEISTCCASVSDFPYANLVGACVCAPDNSKLVRTCKCPENYSYLENGCVK